MDIADWYHIMANIMLAMAFFSLLLGLRSRDKELAPLKWMLVASVTSDLTFSIPFDYFDIYIPYTGLVYRAAEFILLIEFYFLVFRKRLSIKLKWLSQLLVPVTLIALTSFEATPLRITNSILFSILSTLWFLKIIREMSVGILTNLPVFWMNSAFLLYFSGSLFLFLLFEPLGKLHETSAIVSYMFHNLLGVIKNILLGVGFWKAIKLAKGQISLNYDR